MIMYTRLRKNITFHRSEHSNHTHSLAFLQQKKEKEKTHFLRFVRLCASYIDVRAAHIDTPLRTDVCSVRRFIHQPVKPIYHHHTYMNNAYWHAIFHGVVCNVLLIQHT